MVVYDLCTPCKIYIYKHIIISIYILYPPAVALQCIVCFGYQFSDRNDSVTAAGKCIMCNSPSPTHTAYPFRPWTIDPGLSATTTSVGPENVNCAGGVSVTILLLQYSIFTQAINNFKNGHIKLYCRLLH